MSIAVLLVCWIGVTQASGIEPQNESVALDASDHLRAIILLIGDGMGEAQHTAARWLAVGQDGQLAMDGMPVSGWSHTASANSSVTDSAAAATAMATGVKTNNGVISLSPGGDALTTILEYAQASDMAVGLVTTAQVTHATPAAFASHVSSRNEMTEIASQMVDHRVDVLLGGGEDEFLPTGETGCYPEWGERMDGRDLISETVAAGVAYVCTPTAFSAVPITTTRLLGLFADEEMTRPFSPTLAQMTQKSIDILSQDPDGFFLMVEGGQIDWACHDNDAANAISDTIGFDAAVAVAQSYALVNANTLVIVTGDHETGGMSVSLSLTGYPDEDGPFYMPNGMPFYVNWTTVGHTSADVPTTAQGVFSNLLEGADENTFIHDAMYEFLEPDIWLPLILYKGGE